MLAGYQADQYIITSCSTAAQQHGADSGRVEGLIPTCTVMYLRQRRVLFLKLASVTTSHNLTIDYDLQHQRHCGGGGSRFKMSTCLCLSAALRCCRLQRQAGFNRCVGGYLLPILLKVLRCKYLSLSLCVSLSLSLSLSVGVSVL